MVNRNLDVTECFVYVCMAIYGNFGQERKEHFLLTKDLIDEMVRCTNGQICIKGTIHFIFHFILKTFISKHTSLRQCIMTSVHGCLLFFVLLRNYLQKIH